AQVRAVLRDLCDSQLVVLEDLNQKSCYRAATEEELLELRHTNGNEGYDDLLAALLYREGPLTMAQIAEKAQTEQRFIEAAVERLVTLGRIQRGEADGTAQYEVRALLIPLGAPAGWEAAVFDHYKAMVKTILTRLNNRGAAQLEDSAGGSTYTIDTWPGHPLNEEVSGALHQVRTSLGDLRSRVTEYNRHNPRPEQYQRTVIYAGQCLSDEGND
ncbi:MAG TPA: hypothetical protein VN764_14795, partial [Polyangiaceae bacterium]|nr:hypothetical protein [Polyangiaceae bacterium]